MTDDSPHGLDDPAAGGFAGARFGRIWGWTAAALVVIDAAAILAINAFYGPLYWLTIIATAIGFGLTMLLAAALMGLVYMSAGTGHDEAVDDFARQQKNRRPP
jgi:hypothetical protein